MNYQTFGSNEKALISHNSGIIPELLQIDRRSITDYDDRMDLMRYNNHLCTLQI